MERTEKLSDRIMEHLRDPFVRAAVTVKSKVIAESGNFLRGKGFVELLPTIISPVTDPLNHEVHNAKFRYYDQEYKLMQSMIFHKQLACTAFDRIFIISPNVRLETSEKASSGRHLFEFTQIDLEMRDSRREDVMEVMEGLIVNVITSVKRDCGQALDYLGSDPAVPSRPFPKVKYLDAYDQYGKDFETILSKSFTEPFWLIDIPIWEREFYDRLSDDGKTLVDMDLILPLGFGEVLSGGEREWEYRRIVKRMEFKGNDPKELSWYMEIAEDGGLVPTAGCGFGVERLTRYICSLDHVAKTRLFPKVPGQSCI